MSKSRKSSSMSSPAAETAAVASTDELQHFLKRTFALNDIRPKASGTGHAERDPSAIANRLPNIVFTGPNGLYDHRVNALDPQEIGIGRFSMLRSNDIGYLTRGQSGELLKQRRDFPGEIGWTANFFQNVYPVSVSGQRPPAHGYYEPR